MNFDEFAKNYKSIQNENIKLTGEDWGYFLQNKARFAARQLPGNFAGNILDFGCGIGGLSRELKKLFPSAVVDGFDVSADSIREVSTDLKAQGTYTSDLSSLKSDYQAVVVSGVFHHVPPEDRLKVAADIRSKMARDGVLILFEHNPLNPLTRHVVRQCEFDKDAILVWPSEMRRYLEGGGFRIHSRTYMVFFPKFLSVFRTAERYLGWLPLGATYAVVARPS
jgi:2-polyprenyl-3-methyl-5-hydroxy-6-metoxy-1,4-benzoquinol methylase